MTLFFEGVMSGLVLAILLGPIFIVTIHTSLESGQKAGLSVTSGIWMSDLLFIFGSYFFVSKVESIIKQDGFDMWMALIGGGILCIFGMVTLFKKSSFNPGKLSEKLSLKSFSALFSKGFLVNTINPFSIIFWLSVITSSVFGRNLNPHEAFLFLSGIFLTIVTTDTLKVLTAEYIRKFLSQKILTWITRIAGLGILIGGVYLLTIAIVK